MRPDADLNVRRGRRADLPSLVPLSGSADRAEWRVRASDAGDETLLVAEHGGRLLGAVSVRWDAGCDPPHPWLYGLQVRHDARRNGLGAVLVRAAEALARLHGAGAVSLDVDVDVDVDGDEDGLVAYYGRLGYERMTPHEHHWRSVDPSTGLVTAEGTADTWIMRHEFHGPHGGADSAPVDVDA